MFKKGLTLIEVVLTIGIFSLVIVTAFSLIGISGKPVAIISQEFDIQTSSRMIMQQVSEYIKNASAVFIHESIEDIFTDENIYSSEVNKIDEAFMSQPHINKKNEFNLALEKYRGWSFITVSSDGKEIRVFTYNEENNNGYYEMKRIFNSRTTNIDLSFEMDFMKKAHNYDNNLLAMQLIGYFQNKDEIINITTEVETINSLQVVDRSGYKPGKVLFFRNNLDTQAAVAMVLDKSGSMGENTEYNGVNTAKIDALRSEARKLVNSFSGLDNAEISIIPFSTNANNVLELTTAKNSSTLLSYIDSQFKNASGGTNIGDGIRRAYHILKEYNDESLANKEANKYLIILMDGVTTYASGKMQYKTYDKNMGDTYEGYTFDSRYFDWSKLKYRYQYRKPIFKLDSATLSNNELIGNGTERSNNISYGMEGYGMQYIDVISRELSDINNLKIYLIGFFTNTNGKIENSEEYKQFNKIESILSVPGREVDGFMAADGDKLNMAMKDIEESIIGSYWRIYGPRQE